jgi:predicted DNA-binding transcriptional regulator YafY
MDKNFSRLLATLGLLPQHPVKLTAAQIQARLQAMGHAVHVRTVQRDLNEFCQHYPDISRQQGRPLQWGWRAGARVLLLPQMDLPQALAFDLFRREFAQILPDEVLAQLKPWLQEAERKLAQAPRAHASQWTQKIAIGHDGPPLLPAKPLPATLSQVSRALFEGLQIQARYRAAQKPEPKLYVLNPLGLVRQGRVSYLVVTYAGHHDPRLLALHRLDKVQVLDSTVTVPSGFDLQTYLEHDRLHFGSGQKVQLVLHLTKGAAEHLQDTPLSTDQTIESLPDQVGWVVVKATVSESPRLVWWILGFGKRAKVQAPARLVQEVAQLRG